MSESAGPGAGACMAILAIMAVLLVVGGIGKVATAGYHCHWITVGQSRVCQ